MRAKALDKPRARKTKWGENESRLGFARLKGNSAGGFSRLVLPVGLGSAGRIRRFGSADVKNEERKERLKPDPAKDELDNREKSRVRESHLRVRYFLSDIQSGLEMVRVRTLVLNIFCWFLTSLVLSTVTLCSYRTMVAEISL